MEKIIAVHGNTMNVSYSFSNREMEIMAHLKRLEQNYIEFRMSYSEEAPTDSTGFLRSDEISGLLEAGLLDINFDAWHNQYDLTEEGRLFLANNFLAAKDEPEVVEEVISDEEILESTKAFNLLVDRLREEGYEVNVTQEKLYKAANIRDKGIRAAFCTKHDEYSLDSSVAYLNDKIAADNQETFNKWSQCPFESPLPRTHEDLDNIVARLAYWASEEGREASNNFLVEGDIQNVIKNEVDIEDESSNENNIENPIDLKF